MDPYPLKFEPIYQERIWGGRRLAELFGRELPPGKKIGESWELADLPQAVSVVSNGLEAGKTLTELMGGLGHRLLGPAKPMPDGRFPLLLKLLDARGILSLQVHPDAEAARRIGGAAASKTECWYVIASDGGYIYKGLSRGVTRERFLAAVRAGTEREVLRRVGVAAGDFHFLPAGTVHALGPGVVLAEVQTPSDTTYRVTDWGRGRQTHLELAMQCIHFGPAAESPPGAGGEVLAACESFTVRKAAGRRPFTVGAGRCQGIMHVAGEGPLEIAHDKSASAVSVPVGGTCLIPAGLAGVAHPSGPSTCLVIDVGMP